MFENILALIAGPEALVAIMGVIIAFIIWFWLDNRNTHWSIISKIDKLLEKLHGDHISLQKYIHEKHVEVIKELGKKANKD